jgi:hypothetical protein
MQITLYSVILLCNVHMIHETCNKTIIIIIKWWKQNNNQFCPHQYINIKTETPNNIVFVFLAHPVKS